MILSDHRLQLPREGLQSPAVLSWGLGASHFQQLQCICQISLSQAAASPWCWTLSSWSSLTCSLGWGLLRIPLDSLPTPLTNSPQQ